MISPYSNIHSTRSIPTVERLGHSDIWAYHYRPGTIIVIRNAVFAMAYAWSMELLAFALDGMELSRALATSIYSIAIERRLVELMEFAHEKGADTTDGCDIAAKFWPCGIFTHSPPIRWFDRKHMQNCRSERSCRMFVGSFLID